MEGLGRVFNVVPTADAEWINLTDATGAAFVCVGADTYTLQSAASVSGTGAADLDVVDHWYANANADGSTPWTESTRTTPDAAVTIAAGIAVLEVHASQLPAGHTHVRVSSTATGLVTAITHDLNVMRAPANLPAVSS